MREDLESNVAFHLDAGLPGDRSTVLVLDLAMTGLILEHLTLPALLEPESIESLTETIVATVVPVQ